MAPPPNGIQQTNQDWVEGLALKSSQNETINPMCPYCYTMMECQNIGPNKCLTCNSLCDVRFEEGMFRAKRMKDNGTEAKFGKGLAIGFSILLIIWSLEIIYEFSAINYEKKSYYGSKYTAGDSSFQYDECNPNHSSYSQSKCSDLLFDDYIASKTMGANIDVVEVVAWVLIWGSLSRVIYFNNIVHKSHQDYSE